MPWEKLTIQLIYYLQSTHFHFFTLCFLPINIPHSYSSAFLWGWGGAVNLCSETPSLLSLSKFLSPPILFLSLNLLFISHSLLIQHNPLPLILLLFDAMHSISLFSHLYSLSPYQSLGFCCLKLSLLLSQALSFVCLSAVFVTHWQNAASLATLFWAFPLCFTPVNLLPSI